MNFLLIRHIVRGNKASNPLLDEYQIKLHYARAFMMPVIFLTGIIISFLTYPVVGRMAPVLIPVYIAIIKRIYKPILNKKSGLNDLEQDIAS